MSTKEPASRALPRALLVAVAWGLLAGSAAALQAALAPQGGGDDDFTLSVDVNLVLLNVMVLDEGGRAVTGLEKEHFHVLENRRRQAVEFFQHSDVPASVGLVLDNSRSTRANQHHIINAAVQFLKLLDERDEAFVLHFSDDVESGLGPEQIFSSDTAELEQAVRQLRPIGITRLYDAIDTGLEHLAEGRWPRKALIVFSDGGDNGSSVTREQVEMRLRTSDAPIFLIGLVDRRWGEIDPGVLDRFAGISGGLAFFPGNPLELAGIWSRIADVIHRQYTLGYFPDRPDESGYHDIDVIVRPPSGEDVEVHSREGYLVPAAD